MTQAISFITGSIKQHLTKEASNCHIISLVSSAVSLAFLSSHHYYFIFPERKFPINLTRRFPLTAARSLRVTSNLSQHQPTFNVLSPQTTAVDNCSRTTTAPHVRHILDTLLNHHTRNTLFVLPFSFASFVEHTSHSTTNRKITHQSNSSYNITNHAHTT